jgi:Ca2+-binding RTX toxin-like protein
MVTIVRHDLEFMLRQIKISEEHASGTPLTEIRVDTLGNVTTDGSGLLALSNPLLPYGLRTVDGSYNNLGEGREMWGASNQPFLSLLDPVYRDEQDEAPFPLGPMTQVANTDYGVEGNVVDSDPRLISNLIVDQTVSNPAAIAAGLQHAGLSGSELEDALHAITALADPAERAALLATYGVEVDDGTLTISLPNVAPDEGLSASYNSWFTLFGQFFDHGLDLVKKGGSGTVFIPLQHDDPLYVEGSHTNFMALTRIDQSAPNNLTTPFVDQNQTYTSHPSHQVFLREYEMVEGQPVATGRLLGGERGLATWGDVKQQALEKLGIELTDADVSSVPLLRTDPYGRFIPDANGFPQLIAGLGDDGVPNTADDITVSGTPGAPVGTGMALRTPNAFLDDIAHDAVPVMIGGVLQPNDDTNAATGTVEHNPMTGQALTYNNELLEAHYITGDGRGNENIGLSTVHHVFHSEHNRTVEQVKQVVLATGDLAFLNEWLAVPVAELPETEQEIAALSWNGERLFQSARFTTEMQYQHLVFEEFARKVQPDVDVFVFNPSMDINPAILAEFAHVVYRFGHSMLNQTVDRIDQDGHHADMDLFEAFLNPLAFGSNSIDHDTAAAAIVRGMTAQVGNEIDEFVTDVLRNQLLGIPLDLATINIARARDAGIPALNEARRQFKEIANGDTQLDPYANWVDFALNLKTPASIVNFIAAYGTHDTILAADTLAEKRDAATKLVFGDASLTGAAKSAFDADRIDFLNARGAYAGDEGLGGLEQVDLWVGGLAEKKMAFGGMLGSTFSFIFELQMENLQNGDRFYYLSRVQGLNLLNELENNSLAKMVLNNTDLGEQDFAMPGDIFSVPDHVLYVDAAKHAALGTPDPEHDDPFLEALVPMVERGDQYLRYNGNDHVVIGGTDQDDTIIAGGGDDAVWGFDGNDRIEAGYGVDKVHGGAGNDIITNNGTDIGETDMLHGEEGNDVIHGGSGLALIFGGPGKDVIFTGPDGKEAFGGTGDDFILGGEGGDFLLGNEGDDWLEGGNGFDVIAGDNSELFFNSSIIGHDVMFAGQNEQDFDAESGDDIMVQGESVIRNEGMFGFDWAIHKGMSFGANADLLIRIFETEQQDILRNRFDQVEGLSGWDHDDRLRGDNRSSLNDDGPGAAEARLDNNELTQAGVDRIAGLRELLGGAIADAPDGQDPEAVIAFDLGNILLGGGGSDIIEGRGGNDIIDGDAWLNVRLLVDMPGATPDFSVDSLVEIQTALLTGQIRPEQLSIVREIVQGGGVGDVDTAVFSGNRDEYDITLLEDGTLVVAHDGGDGLDGTDRLRNIERLRFADGDVSTPNGTVTISDVSPTETMQLMASLSDPDSVVGLPSFTWQAETAPGIWTDVGSGAAFTPTQDEVGLRLRVAATYADQLGTVAIPVVSAPSIVVGDHYAGTNAANAPVLTAGDDIAIGAGGNDLLQGLAGDDTLNGGNGADTMAGGDGDDLFIVSDTGDLVIELADGGYDTVRTRLASYELTEEVEVLAFAGTGDFTGTGNGLANLIRGGNGADTLAGGGNDDTLHGAGGADHLSGGDGNDLLRGHGGSDTLEGGAGNDLMNGGDGADVFMFGAGFGLDVIQDFGSAPGADQDLLDVSMLGITAAGFATEIEIVAQGTRTLVTIGSDRIVLLNVSAATVTADDFLFA